MKWIIDTDIGDDIDDLYALGYAIATGFDLLGITTVFRSCELRAKLAKYASLRFGKDIPVYAGEDLPINTPVDAYCKPQRWLSEDLYQKYLENGEKWLPQMLDEAYNMQIESLSAVDFMGECVKKYGEELGIIAIGPLTNLARAIQKYPEEMNRVGAFYVMGGDTTNLKPEWNAKNDIDAYKIVYSSKVKKYAVGSDQTWMNAGFDYDYTLKGLTSSTSALNLEKDSLIKWKQQPLYTTKNPCMHDVIVLDSIINAEEYIFEKKFIKVITEGEFKGVTMPVQDEKECDGVVHVLTKMCEEKFKNNFVSAMKKL